MTTKTFLLTGAIGAALAMSGRADFFDNFDSATSGSLNGQNGWVVDTGTFNISSAASHSGANAVAWTGSAAARAHHDVMGGGVKASMLDWSFWYNDVGATRDYNSIYAYSGGWGSGLQTVLAFGDYNSVVGKYEGRYSSIAGAVYGDGALSDGGTAGWFSLGNGGGAGATQGRVNGWHFMEVKGQIDPTKGAGYAMLSFYIDNNLVGDVAQVTDYNLTWATIGGAVSVGVTGGNTDDYSIAAVPEPSAVAIGLCGGLGLWFGLRRRR
jgi:hypothetical protein